jgi:hypothetical protein
MFEAVDKFLKQLIHNYTPIRPDQNFLVDLGSVGDDGVLYFMDRGFLFHRFKPSAPDPCPEPGITPYPGQPESRLIGYITECCIPYPDGNGPSGPFSILVLRYEYKTNHRWITKSVDSHVVVHGAMTFALDGSLNQSQGVNPCNEFIPFKSNTFSIDEWGDLFDEIALEHPIVGNVNDFTKYLQCDDNFDCLHPLCPPCDTPGYWLYIMDDYLPVTPFPIPFVLPKKIDDPIQILIDITSMIAGMLGVEDQDVINGTIDFINGWLVLSMPGTGESRGECYPGFLSKARVAFRYCDCPPGLTYRRGACVELLECSDCQEWDEELQQCVDVPCPECPEGTYLVDGECLDPVPPCPPSSVYLATLDECYELPPDFDPDMDPPRPEDDPNDPSPPDWVWDPPSWRPSPDPHDPIIDPPKPPPLPDWDTDVDWEWDGRDWTFPTRDFNPDFDPPRPDSHPDWEWRGPGWRFPWPEFNPDKDPPNPKDSPDWPIDDPNHDPPSDPIWDPRERDWRKPNGPCPPGYVNTPEGCRKRDVSCPPGYKWDGLECVKDPVLCPPECYWDGTECVCPDPDNDLPDRDLPYRDPYDRDDDTPEDPPYVRPVKPPRDPRPNPRPPTPPTPPVDPCVPPFPPVSGKSYRTADIIRVNGSPPYDPNFVSWNSGCNNFVPVKRFMRFFLGEVHYVVQYYSLSDPSTILESVNRICRRDCNFSTTNILEFREFRCDGTSVANDLQQRIDECEDEILGTWRITAFVTINPSSVGKCIPKLGLILWFINRFLDMFKVFENTQYMKYDYAVHNFENRKRSDGPPTIQATDLGAQNWSFVHKGEFVAAFLEGSFPWTPCMDYSLTIDKVVTKFIPYQ